MTCHRGWLQEHMERNISLPNAQTITARPSGDSQVWAKGGKTQERPAPQLWAAS